MHTAEGIADRAFHRVQRQAEIGEDGVPVLFDDDIRRFDIAMNDVLRVGIIERVANIAQHAYQLLGRHQLTLLQIPFEDIAQVAPVDVFHRDVI